MMAKRLLCATGLLILLASVAQADWQATERIVTYAVRGRSGIELYEEIGHRGPTVGKNIRAIAHTNFTLTWQRKYEVQGRSCVLTTAVPKLTITTTLPKPAEPLASPTRENWKVFIDGIAAHERHHGELIEAMTREIEQATVGLAVPDDPGCRKIKAVMTERLGAISKAEQRASNEFDRVEMGPDGSIPKLALALVNGDLPR